MKKERIKLGRKNGRKEKNGESKSQHKARSVICKLNNEGSVHNRGGGNVEDKLALARTWRGNLPF